MEMLENINEAAAQQADALTASREKFARNRAEIFFVDSSVAGAEALMLGLGEGSKVYALENSSNVFEQIEQALATFDGAVDAVHIYGYGRDGAISLGGQWIDQGTLEASADILARIGSALAQNADILLYGCNTGAGSLGMGFIRALAEYTGADVAASDDITGSNGDWTLESTVGAVETEPRIPGGWDGSLDAEHSEWGIIGANQDGDVVNGYISHDILMNNGHVATLAGGEGNDAYYVSGENANDVIIDEKNGEGVDSVISQVVDYDLSAANDGKSIEYVILNAQQGMVVQNAKGDSQGNTILGNNLSNMLTGGGGNDILYGYGGNDYLDGGNGVLAGAVKGIDYENGESNTLVGGTGDDQYIVRNSGDRIEEGWNEGIDHVYSFVDYDLNNTTGDPKRQSYIENLTLLNSDDETVGTRAIGNSLNNLIVGNDKGNYIDGGAGADTMIGGWGADTFVVDNYGDVVRGEPDRMGPGSAGLNHMIAYINVDLNSTLADGSERFEGIDIVELQGNAKLNLTAYRGSSGMTLKGNAAANVITGSDGDGLTKHGSDHIEAGAGNDTIYAGGGNDYIDGGLGNDIIYAGDGNDTIVVNGGNDQIWTGEGRDVIKVTAAAVGASIQVKEFDASKDCINESDLTTAGWEHTVAKSGKNAVITWVNPANKRQKITLTLLNTDKDQVRFGQNEETDQNFDATKVDGSTPWEIVATGTGQNIVGGNNDDVITSQKGQNDIDAGDGDDIVYSHGGGDTIDGGAGNDRIYFMENFGSNHTTEVDAGAGDDHIRINGITSGNAELHGGDGYDIVTFEEMNQVSLTFSEDGGVKSISSGGANVTVAASSGVEEYRGTSGDDVVDATLVKETFGSKEIGGRLFIDGVRFVTNGGNDRFTGGDALDAIYLHALDSQSAVAIDGGGDTSSSQDMIYFDGSQSTSITLADNGDVSELKVNDSLVANTRIEGIESFHFTGGNNVFRAGDAAIASIVGEDSSTGHSALMVAGGEGNDYIELGNANARFYLTARGGEGNDTISVRRLSAQGEGEEGSVVEINGGGGYDELRLNSGEGMSLTFNGDGNIQDVKYFNPADTAAGQTSAGNVQFNGFEAIDGSGNAANIFTANARTLGNGQSLALTGSGGNDVFSLGTVKTGASAYLNGNGGNDSFILGEVGKNAVVNINGGAGDDSLSFANTANAVRMTLDKWGNLAGAVSVAGQKTMVTSSGISHYSGGNGADYIAANAVTAPSSDYIYLSGGGQSDRANDTITAVNNAHAKFEIQAGYGNDNITGGSLDDRIILGFSDKTDNDGGDTITTGKGSDTLVLNAHENGANITVTDFDANLDFLDDRELIASGWRRGEFSYDSLYRGKTVIAYSKGDVTFYLHFSNITFGNNAACNTLKDKYPAIAKATVNETHVLDQSHEAGAWVLEGSKDADHITASRGGSTIIGGGGNDTIDGQAGADSIVVKGGYDSVVAMGMKGDDTIIVEGAITGATAYYNIAASEGNDSLKAGAVQGGTLSMNGGSGSDYLEVGLVSGGTVDMKADGDGNVFVIGGQSGAGKVSAKASGSGDTFYVGDVANWNLVTLQGGSGDKVFFNGNAALDLVLSASGEGAIRNIGYIEGTARNDTINALAYMPGAIINGGDGDDELLGTSSQALYGGNGDDLLTIANFDAYGKNATVNGGGGTDTLVTSFTPNSASNRCELKLLANRLVFGDSEIALTDVEVIRLDSYGEEYVRNELTLGTKITGKTIEFGWSGDTLKLSDDGAGSEIHIRNFSGTGGDFIDANGWKSASSVVNGSTRYVFTKSGKSAITVWLDNVVNQGAIMDSSKVYNVGPGDSVTMGTGADTINVTLGGNSPVYVHTGGAQGGGIRDMVYLNVAGNSSAKNVIVARMAGKNQEKAHARLFLQGNGVTATFGNATMDGAVVAALTSVKSGNYTASLSAYGFSRYVGTTGDDSIDASGIHTTPPKQWDENGNYVDFDPHLYQIEYETNGGNDTFLGSAGNDRVEVSGPLNASTSMSLNGGAGYDSVDFNYGGLDVTLDGKMEIHGGLLYNGAQASGTDIVGFEQFSVNDGSTVRINPTGKTMLDEWYQQNCLAADEKNPLGMLVEVGSLQGNPPTSNGDNSWDNSSALGINTSYGDDTVRMSGSLEMARLSISTYGGDDSIELNISADPGSRPASNGVETWMLNPSLFIQDDFGDNTIKFSSSHDCLQTSIITGEGRDTVEYTAASPQSTVPGAWSSGTINTGGGDDSIIIGGDNQSFTIYVVADSGNDTIDAASAKLNMLNLEGGTGDDLIKVSAEVMDVELKCSNGDGSDNIEVYGVGSGFQLEQLTFSYNSGMQDGVLAYSPSIQISGYAGGGTLRFNGMQDWTAPGDPPSESYQYDVNLSGAMANDRLTFYGASAGPVSVDLGSIASALMGMGQDTVSGVKLTFDSHGKVTGQA